MYPYIVIERRATEKDYIAEFTQARDTFERIDEEDKHGSKAVYVKKVLTDDACRVLCLSEGHEQKETAWPCDHPCAVCRSLA